jgi:hypothetical protein
VTNSPHDVSLIVIPYLEYSDEELLTLKDFVEQGGTLLVMDDYGFGNSILEYLGISIRFSGKPLLDQLFCYKNQAFPKITDFSPAIVHDEMNVVVLNHATAFQDTSSTEVLAWSSASSYLDINENGNWDGGEPPGSLPVAARIGIGKGTLVLASDPSLVVNSMVNRDGNSIFVTNLINQEGGERKVQIDISHLPKTPLDVSKAGLFNVREILSAPYPLLAIVLVIFVAISRFVLKIGG